MRSERAITPGGGSDAAPDAGGAAPRRARGRPARVTRAQIAEAALAVGLERATVRRVAARLGMSVPGLYHHVRSREALVALAAAHGLASLRLPEDRGEPWPAWLLAYARYVHDALVAQPELVGQILAGRVDTLRQAQHLEHFFAVLGRHGFDVDDAYAVYARLTASVIGAAASEIGRRAARRAGHAPRRELRRAVRALGEGAVPRVHALVRGRARGEPDPFDAVRLTVSGIEQGRRDARRSGRGPGAARSPGSRGKGRGRPRRRR